MKTAKANQIQNALNQINIPADSNILQIIPNSASESAIQCATGNPHFM